MKSNYQIKNIAFFALNRQISTYNNSYTNQNRAERQAPLHPVDCRGEIVCEIEKIVFVHPIGVHKDYKFLTFLTA